jgi:pimeloyl-ACP methyl ester carboxylesterase
MVPLLANKFSLFIPELPGYGISSASTTSNSRLTIAMTLLEALSDSFSIGASDQKRKVILGGHDRGARICHRLAVSFPQDQSLDLVAVVLLDIVPTKAQWDNFANPAVSMGYFHWPFLANVDVAVPMIKAFGGGNWARGSLANLAGSHPVGRSRLLEQDGGAEVYAALFDKEETLIGTCEDYKAGSKEEYEDQKEDQAAGRKINVPTLVMFSQAKLGKTADVAATWKDWIASRVPYEGVGVGDGVGHYLPEEAADAVSDKILQFMEKYA